MRPQPLLPENDDPAPGGTCPFGATLMANAESARLRRHMVLEMVGAGAVRSDAWQAAFEAVPREPFIPVFYTFREGGGWDRVEAGQPAWLPGVYEDDALVTRYDPDRPDAPTSSSSRPSLMARMLDALDVQPDHRVLEIGTGTGYNAALLCAHSSRDDLVTTIDVDAALVDEARSRLDTAGYHPHVAVVDGNAGYPARAPYDRIIATCQVRLIPGSWIEQTSPGGVIVAIMPRSMVRLTVGADGAASGRFDARSFGFMRMTGQWPEPPDGKALLRGGGSSRPASTAVMAEAGRSAFWFVVEMVLVGYQVVVGLEQGVMTIDAADRSWMLMDWDRSTVTQGGPRRLMDEQVALLYTWRKLGSPSRERFGLTITPDGRHTLWLDDPESGVRWDVTQPAGRS